jgi:hypothetical protein
VDLAYARSTVATWSIVAVRLPVDAGTASLG